MIPASLVCFTATLGLAPLLTQLALHVGLVDRPGGRKRHGGLTPLAGGPLMFMAFAIGLALVDHTLPEPIMIGAFLIMGTGLIDDLAGLTPRLRLFLQTAIVTTTFYWSQTGIHQIGDPLAIGRVELGLLTGPFTVLCAVGVINAINMMDGVDGLAAGMVAGGLLGVMLAYQVAGAWIPPEVSLLLAAVLGFMAFNARHPFLRQAIIYMGDSGSYLLGYLLVYFVARVGCAEDHIRPLASAWILALPVTSTLQVMLKRRLNGKSCVQPGRDHFHHLLLDGLGWSAGRVAWIFILLNFNLATLGVILNHWQAPDWLFFGGLLGLLGTQIQLGNTLVASPTRTAARAASEAEASGQ